MIQEITLLIAQCGLANVDRGFSRVRPLHGGLDAWVAAGYALDQVTAAEWSQNVKL